MRLLFCRYSVLESEDVTALSTAAGQDTATALRAAANKEAVRASALDLGRLVGTFRCHIETPPVRIPAARRGGTYSTPPSRAAQ